MSVSSRALLAGLGVFAAAAGLAPEANAQAPSSDTSASEIVVTGTRVANRSRLDTVAPVDVISNATLTQTGTTELNQALSVALPSFNFPRPAITDGTDSVRPATLRSLAPDQTLVLVNSKRRHTSALVNVNGSIGRGSSAVDLNTLPSAAVGSIEVLRDGASAQYGSDAIAGVINVRLREASEGGGATVTYGQRMTDFETTTDVLPTGANWTLPSLRREEEDGQTTTVSGWVGLPLTADGFLTISGEYRQQDPTNRSAPDPRQQYPLVGTAFDPREQTINRVNARFGDPELDQYTIFANAGINLQGGAELYGWASYQNRDALSAGFFRRPIQQNLNPAQNIISIYPNGFLPKINAQIEDFSAAGGARFDFAGWDMDASVTWGQNTFDFGVRDTLNVTLGPASTKRSFEAGGLEVSQIVGNIGGVRGFDVGLASPMNVAIGLEAKQENYKITPGEPDSYRDGGFQPAPPNFAAPGAQVFPGFRPSDAQDRSRESVGAYVDVEANLTEKLLVSGAVRAESYSDFGENVTGKLAGRYDFSDGFALRSAISTGFRAPSLQQQFFTSTATNFINRVPTGAPVGTPSRTDPYQIATVPATSATGVALGGKALEAEESTNYSLGAVLRAGSFTLTGDAYFIEITDRIILSGNIFPTALGILPVGIDAARFFINGVDTETLGFEIVATQKITTESVGDFDLTLSGNFNNTVITKAPASTVLFDRAARLTLIDGQPKEKVTFNTNWSKGNLGATFRSTYFGSVVNPNATNPANDVLLGQKTLFDVEGRIDLSENIQLALGAENLTDVYPDATPGRLNTTGAQPFNSYSPFGFNGRYVYGRVSLKW